VDISRGQESNCGHMPALYRALMSGTLWNCCRHFVSAQQFWNVLVSATVTTIRDGNCSPGISSVALEDAVMCVSSGAPNCCYFTVHCLLL